MEASIPPQYNPRMTLLALNQFAPGLFVRAAMAHIIEYIHTEGEADPDIVGQIAFEVLSTGRTRAYDQEGVDIDEAQVVDLLKGLGFNVEVTTSGVDSTVSPITEREIRQFMKNIGLDGPAGDEQDDC